MPIYEYRCRECGTEFEEWQKISAPAVSPCKQCGGTASRMISHSAFHLKGTGWYVTDYGRKDQSSHTSSSTSSSSVTASSSSD
jgi:putative FmdB family regulatory protein